MIIILFQEAEAKSIQALVENNAQQAGEKAGEDASKDGLEQAAEEAFLADIIKICEEEGLKKGQEIYGDFGGQVKTIIHLLEVQMMK